MNPLQFNVRNAFENGRLQTITVNPNGHPDAFRIIDPRQFIISTTLDPSSHSREAALSLCGTFSQSRVSALQDRQKSLNPC